MFHAKVESAGNLSISPPMTMDVLAVCLVIIIVGVAVKMLMSMDSNKSDLPLPPGPRGFKALKSIIRAIR